MDPDAGDDSVRWCLGPVALRHRSLPRQLVALVLVFVGAQVLAFGVDLAVDGPVSALAVARPRLGGAAAHVALGLFVLGNGLYVAGFRVRRPGANRGADAHERTR